MADRDTIAAVRQFSRFYTRKLGILREGLYSSPFSLGQVRILYEIANRKNPTSTQISGDLDLDAGYFSRLLHSLEKKELVKRRRSEKDGRQSHLSLTQVGKKTFAQLNARSEAEVESILRNVPVVDHSRLVSAMALIQRLLEGPSTPELQLHDPGPGDMGWVVQRHGVLYESEYGYNEQFEAIVAGIVARFMQKFDEKLERCWIARLDSQNVGSVFCAKKSSTVAQLRLLLVEPSARGFGIGVRLVQECIEFARKAGYQKMILWTQSELHAARAIYKKFGFRCAGKEKHSSWGRHNLTSEIWELRLR